MTGVVTFWRPPKRFVAAAKRFRSARQKYSRRPLKTDFHIEIHGERILGERKHIGINLYGCFLALSLEMWRKNCAFALQKGDCYGEKLLVIGILAGWSALSVLFQCVGEGEEALCATTRGLGTGVAR